LIPLPIANCALRIVLQEEGIEKRPDCKSMLNAQLAMGNDFAFGLNGEL
jgi:hypothetical protein